MFVTQLKCLICGSGYAIDQVEYTCPACGIEGILDIEYDYEKIANTLNVKSLGKNQNPTLWRYLPLLPLPYSARLSQLSVGWTPIYQARGLAKELDVSAVYVKDEGLNPTGSYKDRASAVGAARAMVLGRKEIACSSTGNAACSLAGICAELGLKARIFVPADAPKAKVAQLLIYGATVFLIEGSYAQAFDLCQQAVESFNWYNRNCAVNPFLVEGKKTGGLEIAEQMREILPDVVVVPVGDGCIVSGVGKGLKEMKLLGITNRVPRIIGVQAEGSAPIANAFFKGEEKIIHQEAHTLADSICVGTPRNWRKALRAVSSCNGNFVTVSDEQILAAIPLLAQNSGVFAEPTACAALAGAIKARKQKLIDKNESVLILATGNGLKDANTAMRAVQSPLTIQPNLESVRKWLN